MRRATVEGIEAIVVEAWQHDGFDVFIRRTGDNKAIYRPPAPGETAIWEPMTPGTGTLPAPSFFLPADALEALVAAGSGLKPPTEATRDHLADTIKVRDRLLDITEAAAANAPSFYDTLELLKIGKR